jgi:hypothetical protein
MTYRTRAQYIQSLCEEHRSAYQVLITPNSEGARVRFMDDHLGNPDLKFPPVQMSTDDLFHVIPHNEMTHATFSNALARGESYGLLVDPRVIARLARWGTPEVATTKYQHTFNKRYQTTSDFNRDGIASGRV